MLNLTAEKRDGLGKGANRRLRAAQKVPAVFYGQKGENITLQVDKLALEKIYRDVRRTNVFTLEIDDNGKKTSYPVIIWDTQYHPTKSTFTHVDFYGVDLKKEVQRTIPVEFTGVSRGAKAGGKIEVYREFLRLSAKPEAMPAKIYIDISNLDLSQTIRVEEVELPKDVRAIYKSSFAMISCIDSRGAAKTEEASA